MNKVAIAILNWNGWEHLEQFLPSVIEHTPEDVADIIVVDNGSTDESLIELNTYFPSVQLIELDKNYGFADGYNLALRQIEQEYTVLLNSDVEVTENWLEPLLNEMEADSSIAACQPKVRAYRQTDHFEHAGAAGGFIDRFGYPFCRGRIVDCVEQDNGQHDTPIDIFWATGACCMVRTKHFVESGGLDGFFFAHMEEIDWCWRMKNRGHRIVVVPQSVVFHLGGATLGYESPRKLFLNFRNSLYMLFKNLAKRELIWVLFIRMILDGVAAAKFIADGKSGMVKPILHAHMQFYRSIPRLIKQRKKLGRKSPLRKHTGVLRGSIIYRFFIKRKRRFEEVAHSIVQKKR